MKPPKAIKIIVFAFVAATVVMATVVTVFYKKGNFNGGFTREFDKVSLTKGFVWDLGVNSYYFAGVADNKLFLGNISSPSYLLSVDMVTGDTVMRRLTFPKENPLLRARLMISVDSLNKYAWDGSTPVLLDGPLTSGSFRYRSLKPLRLSSIPAILSPDRLIARSFDSLMEKRVLMRVDVNNIAASRKVDVLEKQVDGIFCTDGFLLSDPSKRTVAYVYYYRNGILIMDNELRLRLKANTVDTVSTVHISIGTIESEGGRVMSSPPAKVNHSGAMTADRIFIHSALMGDWEDPDVFEQLSTIDVYSTSTGKYLFSVSVPNIDGKKISHLTVSGNTLYALQGNFLASYRLLPKPQFVR